MQHQVYGIYQSPVQANFIFPPLPSSIVGDFNRSTLTLVNAGSETLPLPSDDKENEVTEGYILLLQIDPSNMHPVDARRVQFLNRYILVSIEDDDSKT